MSNAELDFPELIADAPAAPPAAVSPRTDVATAAAAQIDLRKVDLEAAALAHFGEAREAVAKAKETLDGVVHDLSTPGKLADAKSLRNRLINIPLADARKVSAALKSKLTAVSKAVGVELTAVEADFAAAEKLITPQIEKRDAEVAEEKRIAAEKEAARKQAHEDELAVLAGYVDQAKGVSAERIAKGIAFVQSIEIDPAKWEEFEKRATEQKQVTIERLQVLHASTLAAEQAAAALDAQRLETERVAAETKAAAEKLAADMAEFERKQAEFQAQQAAAAKLVAEQQAAADAAKGKESQGAKAAEPPETLAQKVLRLGNQMSYFEAAEGDSYRKESGARELCRAEFNAAVKQAIAEGVKVNLRGCLVPTEIINQLQPHADLVAAPAVVTPLADSGNGDTPAPSEREAPPNTPAQDIRQVLKAEAPEPDATDRDEPASTSPSVGSTGAGQAADAAPSEGFTIFKELAAHYQATGQVPAPTPAAERPTLKLGDINERFMGRIRVDAAGLESLGFTAHAERGARLYLESDYPKICAAIKAEMEMAQFRGKAALAA